MKSRLEIALKARIPLVSTTTRDPSNIGKVVQFLGQEGAEPVPAWNGQKDSIKQKCVYTFVGNPWATSSGAKGGCELSVEEAIRVFKHFEAVLVLVNAEKLSPLFYEAGEAPTPNELIVDLLFNEVTKGNEKQAEELAMAMGGLTLLEAEWSVRMTGARKAPMSRAGITATRKKCFPPRQGLEQVDTDHLVYQAPTELSTWLGQQKHFILNSTDPTLRPKGLLLGGPPGTGKTAGAKFIARTLGLPLYRFDASEVKSKWVGESESNLTRTLDAAAHEAPCVVLMDEIEKLFNTGHGDSSGVTKSLLGQLLWFLQESEAKVTFVMTTNNEAAIPPELIRPGRIDTKMVFMGLTEKEVPGFMELILDRYSMKSDKAFKALIKSVQSKAGLDANARVPQADAENQVIQYVKDTQIAAMAKKEKQNHD